MEIVEHVEDIDLFIKESSKFLKKVFQRKKMN